MHRSLAVAILVVLSALPIPLLARQTTQTPTAPTSDPQAITFLRQALAGMGGLT